MSILYLFPPFCFLGFFKGFFTVLHARICNKYNILYRRAGILVSGRREREDSSGDQGTTGRHDKSRPARRSSNHGVGASSVLRPRAGRLPRFSGDARDAADAARLPARLRAEAPRQRRLQGVAQLVRADCQGQLTRFGDVKVRTFW